MPTGSVFYHICVSYNYLTSLRFGEKISIKKTIKIEAGGKVEVNGKLEVKRRVEVKRICYHFHYVKKLNVIFIFMSFKKLNCISISGGI